MYSLLHDQTVVEGSSFIAGPSCALHLAQMGARVIRFDMVGGEPDYRRWPQNERRQSLYWEGLNKGKLSVAIDLRKPEGRELAAAIVTAPGPGRGLFVTNYPAEGFLSHAALVRAAHRSYHPADLGLARRAQRRRLYGQRRGRRAVHDRPQRGELGPAGQQRAARLGPPGWRLWRVQPAGGRAPATDDRAGGRDPPRA